MYIVRNIKQTHNTYNIAEYIYIRSILFDKFFGLTHVQFKLLNPQHL